MSSEEIRFHPGDYAVFFIGLIATASVGIIQGLVDMFRGKKEPESKEEEAEGQIVQRNLSIWPASLSIMASVSAAPFVLGIPAETYIFGTLFIIVIFAYFIAMPVLTHFLFERWYKMEIASMYEYLEMRYNRSLRSLSTALFALTMLLYMGVIVYAPALALSQGISITLCIMLVGIIGILYTVIGGLKGVLWVDAIQMLIILAGVLAVIIKGTMNVGSISKVWDIAGNGSRLQFSNWDADPQIRHTAWTQLLGGFFFILVMFCNQAVVQKVLGLPSLTRMHVTSYTCMCANIIYLILFALSGLVIYANYYDCDPLKSGRITKADQLVPLFVLDAFQDAPGIPGLFTCAVFGATLSSVAGGINALAALTLMDVIAPLAKRYQKTPSKRASVILFKVLVVLYGALTVGIAFLTPLMGSSVIQMALSIVGTLGAPICALFFIGVFCPFVNTLGATVGCLVALVFVSWLNIGAVVTGANTRTAIPLPLRLDGCPAPNITETVLTSTHSLMISSLGATVGETTQPPPIPEQSGGLKEFYEISYMWYSPIGFLTTAVVAILVSAITGFRRGEPVDTALSFACCCYDDDESGEQKNYQVDHDGLPNGSSGFPSATVYNAYDNKAYTFDDVTCGANGYIPEAPAKISEVTRL